MRKIAILVVLVTLALQVAGCGATATPPPTEPPATTEAPPVPTPEEVSPTPLPGPELAAEQVLRIGLGQTLKTLDPHKTSLVIDMAVINQIYSGLFRSDPSTAELLPDLCTDWELSEDGLVYTFHLREGVQWHKGYGEFTAADVKWSIERVIDPLAETSYANEFADIDKVEVIDDYTVRITLKDVYVPFIHKLAASRQGWLMSRKAVEELGVDIGTNPIGTGPFIFDHWIPRTEVVLVANPDYYAGPPVLDKIIFIPIPEPATLEIALETGEIDVMEIASAPTYERFSNNPNITIKKVPSLMYAMIGIDTAIEPLDDVRVRRALAYATNKDEIIEHVLTGVATRADTIVSPQCFGYTEDVTVYDYDPARARELLAEAGYADGFTTTIYCSRTSAYGYFYKAVLAIQAQWAEVGVDLVWEEVPGAIWQEKISNREAPMAYAGTGRPPDPDLQMIYFRPGALHAFTGYDVDELIEAGAQETNEEARRAIYEEIQRKISEDVPCIPLFYADLIVATQNYVQGMEPDLSRGFWSYDTYIEAH